MINLTDTAKKTLDNYLEQVKTSLLACKSVDADEVQKDILDHIERELEEAKQPISVDDLERVLQHLGSPQQWVPDEEISWWGKIIVRLRRGPDDWRLAYLSLGLLVLTFVFPPFFLFSFLLSRAAVALARKRGESLGPQKWLIYPSLLVLYGPFAVLILAWPLAAMPLNAINALVREIGLSVEPSLIAVIMGFFCIAIWWVALGALFKNFPQLLEFLIAPFADNVAQRLAKILLYCGIIPAVISIGLFVTICLVYRL